MADLTANRDIRRRFPTQEKRDIFPLDAASAGTYYKGQPMIVDVSVDDDMVVGFDSSVTPVTGDLFIGILVSKAVVTSDDSDGDVEAEILYSGEVGFKDATFTLADVGKSIYMSDSAVLTATAAGNILIGKLANVQDGYAYVMINPDGTPTSLTVA